MCSVSCAAIQGFVDLLDLDAQDKYAHSIPDDQRTALPHTTRQALQAYDQSIGHVICCRRVSKPGPAGAAVACTTCCGWDCEPALIGGGTHRSECNEARRSNGSDTQLVWQVAWRGMQRFADLVDAAVRCSTVVYEFYTELDARSDVLCGRFRAATDAIESDMLYRRA